MKDKSMNRTFHLAYSSDLIFSDFYLFGYLKQMQIGTVFDDQALLFMAIDFILGGIEK
jgi:hypothetical protein